MMLIRAYVIHSTPERLFCFYSKQWDRNLILTEETETLLGYICLLIGKSTNFHMLSENRFLKHFALMSIRT